MRQASASLREVKENFKPQCDSLLHQYSNLHVVLIICLLNSAFSVPLFDVVTCFTEAVDSTAEEKSSFAQRAGARSQLSLRRGRRDTEDQTD